ncbi:MAG: glycosyltransferase family 4 protein [Planctomycetota bacterium]
MTREASCCILSPFGRQQGGAELSLLHLLRHGRGMGVRWSLALLEDGPIREEADALGLETLVLPPCRTRDVRGMARATRQLTRMIKDQHAQLLISWMAFTHFRGCLAAMAARVPSVWFQKGGAHADSWTERVLGKLPTRAIFANSLPTAHAQRVHSPRTPMFVIPSAVDLSSFDPVQLGSPADNRRRLGLPEDFPLICIVGRLQAWKGFDVLIRSLPAVHAHRPDARVVIVGGKHDREPDHLRDLQQLADQLGVRDQVIFAGAQPHEQVPRYMQAADVIVNASRDEPFGIVVVEGMGLGKPVIGTKPGGPAWVIEDGVNGLLVDYGEPDPLATAIGRALSGEIESARAQDRAKTFSEQAFVRRMTDATVQCIQGRPDPGIWFDDQRMPEPMTGVTPSSVPCDPSKSP